MSTQYDPAAFTGQGAAAAGSAVNKKETISEEYQYPETRELVQLVKDAAELIHINGEAAFNHFRLPESRWRQDEKYIFVLDLEGNMLVHPDPDLEGKNDLELKDINGKQIIRGLVRAAASAPDKPEGWYHYEWPVPGGLLPRWKSSYVRHVKAPSGKSYIVGSGMYNDRMERAFVVDIVRQAVVEIEKNGEAAFSLLRDPTGPFVAKDTYIFATDMDAVGLVNPAFPMLEGRDLYDLVDAQGKYLNRDFVRVAETQGSGWVDYMWPKPGESVATQKSTYVSLAKMGDKRIVVGCGVYLAEAPKEATSPTKMTAEDLTQLVREAVALVEERSEKAFAEFRREGSKWFRDDTYIFVLSMDGTRICQPAEPETEGQNFLNIKDPLGRPFGRMILEAASSISGEGWIHYMYPRPGEVFPVWKSAFAKRATLLSGQQYVVGCGIYNMKMDKAFIEYVVDRAAALISERGREAFGKLRDKTGPFVFMDTYVFVESTDGIELVNAAQPSLEGKRLIDVKDLNGKELVRDEIDLALQKGSGWMDCFWYKPGDNTPALKHTYVRKATFDGETYIVGSGIYPSTEAETTQEAEKFTWESLDQEQLKDNLFRRIFSGEKATLAQFSAKPGVFAPRHSHGNEEYFWVLSGGVKFVFDDREVMVGQGEIVMIPPNLPHSVIALEDSEVVDFFAPVREDWLRGEDRYLRQ